MQGTRAAGQRLGSTAIALAGALILAAHGLAQDPPSPKLVGTMSAHSGGLFMSAEIAPDGSHVAIFGRDHIEFWSVEPVKFLGSVPHEGHPTYHRITPNGLGFVTGLRGELRVGSLEKGIEWRIQVENEGYVGPMAISPSGELIAVALAPGCVDPVTSTAFFPRTRTSAPTNASRSASSRTARS